MIWCASCGPTGPATSLECCCRVFLCCFGAGWPNPNGCHKSVCHCNPSCVSSPASSVCLVLLCQLLCQQSPGVICCRALSLLCVQPTLNICTPALGLLSSLPCLFAVSLVWVAAAFSLLWVVECLLDFVRCGHSALRAQGICACNALCTMDVMRQQAQQPFMVGCLHVSLGRVICGTLSAVCCLQYAAKGHRSTTQLMLCMWCAGFVRLSGCCCRHRLCSCTLSAAWIGPAFF